MTRIIILLLKQLINYGENIINKKIGTIFSQPWWLDAVVPNQWDVIEIKKGNNVIARMPYVFKQSRLGFRMITMPPLTQTLGPAFASHHAKYVKQLSEQHKRITNLIEQLPPFDYFSQNFHYTAINWLPFHWHGFQQTTRYTYVIEDLSNLDTVWKETRENIRRNVRKAKKQLTIRTDLTLDSFLDLNEKTFQRQNLSLPYSRELVYRIEQTCTAQNCRKMFFAEDAQGLLHAAVYIIWDENAAYYLMGGADPELRNSGATSFLMWEAIQFAATVTQTFDFEGSMIQPVERFFRAFGAKQKPYFHVYKVNSALYKMRQDIRSWIRVWRDK